MEFEKSTPKPQLDPLDIENYYEAFKSVTFRTKTIPLSIPEAQAIVDEYDINKFGEDTNKTRAKNEVHLKKISVAIEDTIQKEFQGKEVFIRLSTRSPKDVALKLGKTNKVLQMELKNLGVDYGEPKFSDYQIKQVIAVIRAAVRSVKVGSGEEAIEFLTKSERVYQDLFRKLLGDSESFSMHIILREWVDIAPEYEFRGFIHNNRLNALTQYYKACFVPEMVEKKDSIEKRIKEFFESIKHLLPVKNVVADFAVTPEKIYLIELNHWGTTASPGLFNWTEDLGVLSHGPFEFRILTETPRNVKEQIARPLRALLGWDDSSHDGDSNNNKPLLSRFQDFMAARKTPKKPKYKKLCKDITSKYELTEDAKNINFGKFFQLGGLYLLSGAFWVFDSDYFEALGSAKKLHRSQNTSNLSSTLVVVLLFEIMIHDKSAEEKISEWKEIAALANEYLKLEYSLLHGSNWEAKLKEDAHNTCVMLAKELKLIKKNI